VPVTWRDTHPRHPTGTVDDPERQGAEAIVTFEDDRVVKRRRPKSYRQSALDERLRRERTVEEARLTSAARRLGVPTPVVYDIDTQNTELTFELVGDTDLRDRMIENEPAATAGIRAVADHLATLHAAGIVHGDPTTRNVRVSSTD